MVAVYYSRKQWQEKEWGGNNHKLINLTKTTQRMPPSDGGFKLIKCVRSREMQLPSEGEGEGMIDDASVCLSVRLSVCLSVNPISYLSHLRRKKNVTCWVMSFLLVRFVGKLKMSR